MADTVYKGPGDYLGVHITTDIGTNTKTFTLDLRTISGQYPRLPKDIFVYTNTGTGALGEYQKVCTKEELTRLNIFTPGQAQPIFGNKYVRYSIATIVVPMDTLDDTILTPIKTSITALARSLVQIPANDTVIYLP